MVYANKPINLEELKRKINEIMVISDQILQAVMQNFVTRLEEYIFEDGDHLWSTILS